MKVIYRYNVEITDIQEIPTISGEILTIDNCNNGLSMWILSKEFRRGEEPTVDVIRRIHCIGTGNLTNPALPLLKVDYINTVPLGAFVWHFFSVDLLSGGH